LYAILSKKKAIRTLAKKIFLARERGKKRVEATRMEERKPDNKMRPELKEEFEIQRRKKHIEGGGSNRFIYTARTANYKINGRPN
jgi:ADP-dependent phosphofructokinase/glucokinase